MIDSPESHGFSKIVPDAAHDYFRREIGRPMDEFELKTLEQMTQTLQLANAKLARKGHMDKIRGEGDLIQVFVERVQSAEADAATRKIMVGYTGGRRGN